MPLYAQATDCGDGTVVVIVAEYGGTHVNAHIRRDMTRGDAGALMDDVDVCAQFDLDPDIVVERWAMERL